jgi:hypothetical protein
MRIGALVLLLVGGLALAAPVTLNTGTRFEFTDCSSSGSAAQTVTSGTYVLRVTTEDVWLCYAATCASGGEKFPAGWGMHLRVQTTTSMSCRSGTSTGDLILTRGD